MTTKLYNRYFDGTLVRLSATFTDLSENKADPTTVTCRVKDPSTGASTAYTLAGGQISRDGLGDFHIDLDTTDYAEGTWYYKWIGTGNVTAAEQFAFIINHEETQ